MPPSKVWDAFIKAPQKYKSNQSHYEARCKAEVKLAETRLKEEQQEKVMLGALDPAERLTDAQIHTHGA